MSRFPGSGLRDSGTSRAPEVETGSPKETNGAVVAELADAPA